MLGISYASVHSILHNDLKMQCVYEHTVPRILTDEQRKERTLVSGVIRVDQNTDLFNRVIKGDETCYLYDSQFKRQLSTWKHPPHHDRNDFVQTDQRES